MARFFIDRPIFAWVIAVVLMLAGVIAIRSLPIAQFQEIAPPTVQVNALCRWERSPVDRCAPDGYTRGTAPDGLRAVP